MATDMTNDTASGATAGGSPARQADVPTSASSKLYLRRFLRNRLAVVGVVIFVLLVLFSLFGGVFTSYAYSDADFAALTQPPSATHWFGTNQGGNDVYASAVHGLQRSLAIAVSVSALTVVVAAVIGVEAPRTSGAGWRR